VANQELFAGDPLEQATAMRDLLLNFRKVADMPVIRTIPRPAPEGGKR
jgi:hypothetical protein